MKAVLIQKDQSRIWSDVPDPVIKADEVLVKVHYAALNRADLMQREGNYPPPPGCPSRTTAPWPRPQPFRKRLQRRI